MARRRWNLFWRDRKINLLLRRWFHGVCRQRCFAYLRDACFLTQQSRSFEYDVNGSICGTLRSQID